MNSKRCEVSSDRQRNLIHFRDFVSKKGSGYYRILLVIPLSRSTTKTLFLNILWLNLFKRIGRQLATLLPKWKLNQRDDIIYVQKRIQVVTCNMNASPTFIYESNSQNSLLKNQKFGRGIKKRVNSWQNEKRSRGGQPSIVPTGSRGRVRKWFEEVLKWPRNQMF